MTRKNRPPDDAKYVYVMKAAGLVKIGVSGQPDERARMISAASGFSVQIHFVSMPVARAVAGAVEAAAHHILSGERRQGEWFQVGVRRAVFAVVEAEHAVITGTAAGTHRKWFRPRSDVQQERIGHRNNAKRGFVAGLTATAIFHDRRFVLQEIRRLREKWFDSPDAVAFSYELETRLEAMWHANDSNDEMFDSAPEYAHLVDGAQSLHELTIAARNEIYGAEYGRVFNEANDR